jgi:peptidoglycan/LPS O-acetylase OafA/YrhL
MTTPGAGGDDDLVIAHRTTESSSSAAQPPDGNTARRVALVLVAVAASLAVASTLHLTGDVTGRSAPFDSDNAGIAEAIIGVVLLGGAGLMLVRPAKARPVGMAVNVFALAGFLVGLSMTASGGHIPDLAYHLTVLPILIGTLVVLTRADRPARP